MALSSGTKLGSFEISGLLGVGGMGEVYRARDTKLGREVAIKVLPEVFAKDKDRLARFEREAKLLAALNHPNIAGIHDIQESEGTHFLVMELVEGQALNEKLRAGAMSVEEALPLFAQIAEALESAHEQGIVHRDLKPANIKVTEDGKIKVLDFGLAKAFAEQLPSQSSPGGTIALDSDSAGVTGEGKVLGTPAYMSPEQASGKRVDKRADIWSFGCCLYEALAGERPFKGDTAAELAADILRGEPNWSALPPKTPNRVRDLLWRCLQKDPRRRLRDIGEAWFQISETRTDSSGAFPAVAPPTSGAGLTNAQAMGMGAVCLLLGAVVFWAIGSIRKDEAPNKDIQADSSAAGQERPVRRTTINLGPGETWPDFTVPPLIALSPDGKQLVYVAVKDGVSQVFHRPLARLLSTVIPGGEGTSGVYISSEAGWLALRQSPGIFKLPLSGGVAQQIADTALIRAGIGWDGEEAIYYATGLAGGLNRVAVSGGLPEVVTKIDENEVAHVWPSLLPGGKFLLFSTIPNSASAGASSRLYALELETGRRKLVIEGVMYARYVPTGHLLYTTWPSEPRLMIVPFDPESLAVSGNPVRILPDVLIAPNSRCPQLAYSSDGMLVYVPRTVSRNRVMAWVDRQGNEETIALPAQAFSSPRVSPDGESLIVTIDRNENSDVWRYDLTPGRLSRITSHPSTDYSGVWSSDGSRIYFTSQRAGPFDIFSKSSDGSGEVKRITQSDRFQWPRLMSPDGSSVIYQSLNADSGYDIELVPVSGDREPEALIQGPFMESDPSISPDGRWIAYVSDETGREEVYVRSYPELTGKQKVSTGGGSAPLWAPEGGELFYTLENRLFSVAVRTDPTFSASKPEVLIEGPYLFYSTANDEGRQYDISPLDGRFLVLRADEQTGAPSAQRSMVVVENWFEELKRLAPTGAQQ